jgi:AmmeMemoRadiSam system protein B/AmmeMemoRadiSam system protein A
MPVEGISVAGQHQVPQRPELTPQQQQLLLAASAKLLCATVTAGPADYPDPTLAGAAHHMIAGAFFSLKRGKHLRSCCGGLRDRPVALGEAVADAVVRTALEDARFPVVSPTELEHLDMEVWVLFNPQRVTVRGGERVDAVVTGGKHGLIVSRGEHRGLLLPGVAAEHSWDARRFLEQVCVKAGLHPSLWKDDGTALFTFEGICLRARVSEFEPLGELMRQPPVLHQEELVTYAGFCARNLAGILAGALPQYSVSGVPDGTVSGIVLTLRRADNAGSMHFMQTSLRPGLALQATLFQLTQMAAQQLAAQGISADGLGELVVGLTVLGDPALHGTVAEPLLLGLDTERRAVLVMERAKSGVAYHPRQSAEDLMAAAARQAQVNTPATAAVFSLDTVSTEPSLLMSTAPQPVPGPAVRLPVVAGKFYPGDASALATLVDDLVAGERRGESWLAAMVPHAGLRFSGRIAAAVLKRLHIPRTVIVLGPKHTGLGMEWAVAPHQTWNLPGAAVASDPELARQLAQGIPGLALDALAHRQEHAIEVELPFLARLAPETAVVGIAIGHGDLESCRRFADGLANVLRQRTERPLLLISSDMNHFATDAETRVLDEMALSALDRLHPADVYDTVTQNHISMCGILPAVIVLETLRQLGTLSKAERVGYATSADVTGDPSRVVGYAGMLFG